MTDSFIARLTRVEQLLARLEANPRKTAEEERRIERIHHLLRSIEEQRLGRGPYPQEDVAPAERQRRIAMRLVLNEQLEKELSFEQ